MSERDNVTPGTPADLATVAAIATAAIHLEELTRGGPPRPAPYHEPRQVRRPGPVRDDRGRFKPRR